MKGRIALCVILIFSSTTYGQTHEWFSLTEQVNESVTDLVVYQGKLIVAGGFTQTGQTPNNNIAAWDGASWSSLGAGFPATMPSVINDVIVKGDSLFVVGLEMTSGGIVMANKVEIWNGSNWINIAQANDIINTIEIYNDEIYVGGKFDTIAGIPAKGIAKWNGSTWENLGEGLRYNTIYSDVVDLQIYENLLFATGIIDSAGTIACDGVAFWNGFSWSTIPSGSFLSNYNMYMIEWEGELLFGSTAYFGTDYLLVDIFSWDGTIFSVYSSQYMSYVLDFEIHEGNLYCAGGNVVDYGNTVRMWNGSSWVTVGSGLTNDVKALCTYNGELYAGGWFNETNGSSHNYFARYAELNSLEELDENPLFDIYPNPTASTTTLRFWADKESVAKIDLTDSQGRLVKHFGIYKTGAGEQTILLDLSNVADGLYFVSLSINGEKYFERILKNE